jgi:NAD(P)-dependent dehydrogenase (short-subunit alcohol dehydrogenase family)
VTVVVSGSASGIGAAVRRRLEGAGDRVIGVDLRDADVLADLAEPEGRARAIAAVRQASQGRLDGVVACAGVGPQRRPWSTIVALNFFGATALLDGVRDLLVRGTRSAAVAVSSNSSTLPNADGPLVAACLADDEESARRIALDLDGHRTYAGSKLALARWVRRQAPAPGWAGAGVRLNAVAPGAVLTPLLREGLDDPAYGPAIRGFPIPTGGFGTPEQVAAAVAFLLGPEAAFCCGSVLFVDGGTDALFRPDRY